MALKVFGPGGTDQKSNDLIRDPRNLRDSLNIMYSGRQEYTKRPGTDVDADFSGDVYSDVVFIKSLDMYFFRSGTDYYYYKNGTKKLLHKFADPLLSGSSNISLAEYLGIALFTHQENQSFTAKFDGGSIYRSGLPAPVFSTSQSGPAKVGFMLYFYDFIDGAGNQIFGPSKISASTNQDHAVNIPTFKDTGFYAGYIVVSAAPVTIDNTTLANRTISYSSVSLDIKVGDKIPVRYSPIMSIESFNGVDYKFLNFYSHVMLTIESMTGSTIVFTADSLNGLRLTPSSIIGKNLHGACAIRCQFSTSETTGYTNTDIFQLDPRNLTQAETFTATSSGAFLLSNFYDITTSKLRPPKCKFVCVFGDQVVYAGVLSFFDFQNKENNYTNNDLIFYSDIANGDLGENVSESNRQLIGNTYDGQITGLVRAKDSIIIFKENSIYAIDGILVEGFFSLRKIETDETGCNSDKSILTINNSVLFQGVDGIYAISGVSAKKYSTKIDPFFNNPSFNPALTRAVMDVKNESYHFFTNVGVVTFNYEYKEWFIWDLVNAANGLTVDNSRDIKMFSGSVAKEFIANKNDSGVAINAWIKTAWFDFKEPSLLKKFVDIRFFSLNNAGQTLLGRLFYDWADSGTTFGVANPSDTTSKVKPATSLPGFTVDMSLVSTKTVLRKLDIQQAQSVSLFLGNNVINQDFNLSGFELNGGIAQEKDKNVK